MTDRNTPLVLVLVGIVCMSIPSPAAEPDSSRTDSVQFIPDPAMIRELAMDDPDAELAQEHLVWLLDHPLDLNTAAESDLAALPGMTPEDARRVIRWRARPGSFVSVDQLARRGTEGQRLFQVLAPFVRVSTTSAFHGRLRSRAQMYLPVPTVGSSGDADDGMTREYHRLMLRWGEVAAGELSMVRERGQPYGQAFVAGGISFSWPDEFVERLVAGDISAGCAQGLVLGQSGGSMSDGVRGWGWSGPLRFEPFHGTSGTRVIRGVGASMRVRSVAGVLTLGGFAGRTPFAATLDGEGNITTLALRPAADQAASGAVSIVPEWTAGARLAWIPPSGPAGGITFLWSRLARPFALRGQFSDVQAVRIFGLDLSLIAGSASVGVEGAWMQEGYAVTGRLGLTLAPQAPLSVGGWYASPGFRDRKGGTSIAGSDMVNDAGVAVQCECAPLPGMKCTGAIVRHGRPWRTTLDHMPPEGNEISFRVSQRISRTLTLSASMRSSASESWERWQGADLLPRSGSLPSVRRSYLAAIDHTVSAGVRVQLRIAHVRALSGDPDGGSGAGWLMGTDVRIVCAGRTTIDARWELFSTDSYASRVYLMERDVEGGYSSPPLYGAGFRWYVMVRTAVIEGLTLSARCAATQRDVRLHLRPDTPVLTLQCDAEPASLLPLP